VNTGLTGQSVRALASSGSNLFAGTNGGVFISENNGASWKAVNAGLTENYIECLAAGGSNIFAGTRDGVFRSTDNGANWTSEGKAAMQVLNIPPYIVSMAVMGSTIFAATYENGLFRSLDNGTSWVKILDEDNIHLLVLDDGSIFAGNTDVFVSTDNGTNWVAAGTGLPKLISSTIYSMAVTETHLLAGTLFKGVWSRPLSEFPISQPVVTITSFAPASGKEGTSVTINGTNFGATPANNTVKFNGTVATVTASTTTGITTTVPVGATTGPVMVTTVRGGSATSSTNFTVTAPEIITALEPPTAGDFSIYPNPANDWLILALGKMAGKKEITIYQTTGKQMATLETSSKEANLYVGDYPMGMYIVKVSALNSVGVLKFFKQ
jgi:hypothetical protein